MSVTKIVAGSAFCLSLALVACGAARGEKRTLALKTSAEYGWHHTGHSSGGSNWTRMAVDEANDEIREKISRMANLEELETFTSQELTKKLGMDTEGNGSPKGGGGKTKFSYEDDSKKGSHEVQKYQNNYIVVIDNVRLKAGSDWSHTEKNSKGERKWEAAATVLYDVRIYKLS